MSRVLKILGRHTQARPRSVAAAVLDRMWRYRADVLPHAGLDHIRYVCMVDDARARDVLGFRPKYGLEDTIMAVEVER
ncbi:MAG: hypothetical protein R3B82_01780 [Sandaracinaceae bacterium]